MKKIFKTLWNNWKAIVDEHNSYITYVDYDDTWGYDMLFYPLFVGGIVGLIFGLFHLSIGAFLYGFLGMAVPMYIFLIIIPVLLEQKKKNCD